MTITFVDGPAAGKQLSLRRAPKYLRVAMWEEEIDALDQLDDVPNAAEKHVAYARASEPMTIHVDRNERGRHVGEWHLVADYYVVTDQPTAAVMADNALWRKWCVDRTQIAGGLFPPLLRH